MHSAPAQTRPRVAAVRRLLVALVAAAALAGGAAAVMPIDHTDGSQHARWHQGWFLEDGTWYYGWFDA